jgi:predicted transglutaminase-like cysteine proteinase
MAWKVFCERLPNECVVDSSEPEVIELTRETWAVINAVNEHVNTTIKPMSDREHWGVEDRWDYPEDGYGDCEDYQLLKRRLLVQAGLSRRAMRMTVVVDEDDAGHAVLIVRTNLGDLILDNKRQEILSQKETTFEFIKREGSDGLAWVALGGRVSPVVTANR